MEMQKPLELIQKKGAVNILVTLWREGRLNVSRLSKEAGVSNGTIQRRLEELKEKQLVKKEIGENENNRLEKSYTLTSTGKNFSESLISLNNI